MNPSDSNVWELFVSINLSFPVVFFTFFLVLSLIYWCIAALGLVDLDIFDANTDIDADIDGAADVGSVAGLLLRLGLNGVPLTIIVTFIAFFGWLISLLAVYYLMPLVPTYLLKIVFAVGLLFATLYTATLITSVCIKPLRSFFLAANKQRKMVMVGRTAVVRTGTVTDAFGEANLDDGGAGLIVKVRAYAGQAFAKGDRVVLLEHDAIENSYKVISEKEYQN